LETLFIGAGEVSFLHDDDRNRAQQSHLSTMSDGTGSTVKNNQGGRFRISNAFFYDCENDSEFRKMSTESRGLPKDDVPVSITQT
jgi:hypothetical protein